VAIGSANIGMKKSGDITRSVIESSGNGENLAESWRQYGG
jgi:hypothetical protein